MAIVLAIICVSILWYCMIVKIRKRSNDINSNTLISGYPIRTKIKENGDYAFNKPSWIHLAIVGESYKNNDGKARRDIISRLSVGDRINLIAEKNNIHSYNGKAVAVFSRFGQIGYLADDEELKDHIFDELRKGHQVEARILNIFGGTYDKPNFGVSLDINVQSQNA